MHRFLRTTTAFVEAILIFFSFDPWFKSIDYLGVPLTLRIDCSLQDDYRFIRRGIDIFDTS